MVKYESFELANGLKVILHHDGDSTLAAVNVLYQIGSKNEWEEQTGLTHLFEHMMFTGTKTVPDIDSLLQNAGGENNAFTNADYTNYYSYAPTVNLELLLAIEADRMNYLDFTKEKFEIQKNVVVEEFYETCLNQPYGDVWHLMSDLAYKEHNYRWPTIGKRPEHIFEASYDSVKNYYQYYCPNNAILSIGGNINISKVRKLVDKYFGTIPAKKFNLTNPGFEPPQIERRYQHVHRRVPVSSIYIGFHIPERIHRDFYTLDMVTDFYAYNESSFLHKSLVKEKDLFTSIDAWVVGSKDPGLMLIEGKLNDETHFQTALNSIQEALHKGMELITSRKVEKIKNNIRTNLIQSEVNIMNKVISLAYFEMLGNIGLINQESALYDSIEQSEIIDATNKYIDFDKANILFYESAGEPSLLASEVTL